MHLRTILKNIFSTWVGYAVTLAAGFLLAPFVVHHLGTTSYGVWTLVVSLTGYFGLLDLGLRQSVGRFVARYMALSDHENVNSTVSNALAMLGGAGALGLLATVAVNFVFGVFHIDQQAQLDARIALLIAGLNISLALPMSVFNAVLFALERFEVVTAITIIGTLIRSTLVVVVLSRGHGLIALAAVALFSSSAEYLCASLCAKKLYPRLAPKRRYVAVARCMELFHFGIYRFIWIVSNQVIFYTDSLVIGVFLNAAAITYYAIGGSLINYGRNIISIAADTFFPAATRLDAKNDTAGLQNLLIVGTRLSLAVGLPICAGFLFLGKQFIVLWMGPAYAISALYLSVLTIPQFTSMAQYISALILVGMAKHKVLAYVTLAEGVANLVLSVILVRRIGLVGVAWGTVIPHVVNTAVVIPFFTLRAVKMSWRDYVIRGFVPPVLAAIPAAAVCYAASVLVTGPSWPVFVIEVLTVGATSAVAGYFLCLEPAQRLAIARKLWRSQPPPAAVEASVQHEA